MALTLRQYLRTLKEDTLLKLLKETNLTDFEKDLLHHCFINKYMVEKTCRLLHISKTKYHYSLNEALLKIKYKICDLDKLHTFEV